MFSVGVWSNPAIFGGIAAMFAAQVLITHTGLMNRLFHTAPIDAVSWLYVIAAVSAPLNMVNSSAYQQVAAEHEPDREHHP